jgi:hypothetical protein
MPFNFFDKLKLASRKKTIEKSRFSAMEERLDVARGESDEEVPCSATVRTVQKNCSQISELNITEERCHNLGNSNACTERTTMRTTYSAAKSARYRINYHFYLPRIRSAPRWNPPSSTSCTTWASWMVRAGRRKPREAR